MTEPFGSAVNPVISSDFVEKMMMSFSLLAMVAEHPERTKPGPASWTGGCFTCNPRTAWVLGLHSCRALSPQPRQQAY